MGHGFKCAGAGIVLMLAVSGREADSSDRAIDALVVTGSGTGSRAGATPGVPVAKAG